MDEPPGESLGVILSRIRDQAATESLRITVHAQAQMAEEDIQIDDVLEAIANGAVLEDYSTHRRGACCLLGGVTRSGRHLHVVCTTTHPVLIIIAVYEPKPPRWLSPTERSRRS